MSLYNARMNFFLQQIEEHMADYLPTDADVVSEAMRYACDAGGKRLRPVLVLEWTSLFSGDGDAAVCRRALPFAAAIEMIHSYSLVHDDMPCMDNSPLRRGKPSVHAAYGENMALLAGDGLLNRAFETVLNPAYRAADIPAQTAMTAAFVLGQAAGIEGMVGGQMLDLSSEGRTIALPELQTLQEKKTGALLAAACEMGAVLGGADENGRAAARQYGHLLGRSFQMIDDILDVTSTAEQLGKPTGEDAAAAKNTYVSLLGLDETRRQAERCTREAQTALDGWGERADGLRGLAQALLTRIK